MLRVCSRHPNLNVAVRIPAEGSLNLELSPITKYLSISQTASVLLVGCLYLNMIHSVYMLLVGCLYLNMIHTVYMLLVGCLYLNMIHTVYMFTVCCLYPANMPLL